MDNDDLLFSVYEITSVNICNDVSYVIDWDQSVEFIVEFIVESLCYRNFGYDLKNV